MVTARGGMAWHWHRAVCGTSALATKKRSYTMAWPFLRGGGTLWLCGAHLRIDTCRTDRVIHFRFTIMPHVGRILRGRVVGNERFDGATFRIAELFTHDGLHSCVWMGCTLFDAIRANAPCYAAGFKSDLTAAIAFLCSTEFLSNRVLRNGA